MPAIDLYNLLASLFVGDGAGGNTTKFETDGTMQAVGDATCWEDDKYPVTAAQLDNVSGRIDYNYTENTVDFATNARYPEEPLSIVGLMPHARVDESDIKPHLHWHQTAAGTPNILFEYRWYNNGEAVPASWTLIPVTAAQVFTYPGSGRFAQITPIATLTGTGKDLASSFDVRIYRDSANTSGLFAGVDTYPDVWALKEFDIHYQRDMLGSRQEFIK